MRTGRPPTPSTPTGADALEARHRDPPGQIERGRVLAHLRRRDRHRGRGVEEQVHRHALRRLVLLHVEAPGARGDAPVDRAHGVARHVRPRLHVVDAGAEEAASGPCRRLRRVGEPADQRSGSCLVSRISTDSTGPSKGRPAQTGWPFVSERSPPWRRAPSRRRPMARSASPRGPHAPVERPSARASYDSADAVQEDVLRERVEVLGNDVARGRGSARGHGTP